MIFVSLISESLRNELMTRNVAHRCEHSRIANAASLDLRLHHLRALNVESVALKWNLHGGRRRGLPGRTAEDGCPYVVQYGPIIPPMLREAGGSGRIVLLFPSIISRYL